LLLRLALFLELLLLLTAIRLRPARNLLRRGHGRLRRRGDRRALDLELVDALGLVQALQMPLTEREDGDAVRQARADEGTGRLGQEHVPATRHRADPRGAHDVEAVVALLPDHRLSRVQADSDPDGCARGA